MIAISVVMPVYNADIAYLQEAVSSVWAHFAGCGFKETGLLYDWLQTENGYEDVQMFSLILDL